MRICLRLICLMALGGFLLSGGTAWAQLTDKKVITLGVAKKLAVAAEEEAVKNKWNVVIAIVDDGGACSISSVWTRRRLVVSRSPSRRPRLPSTSSVPARRLRMPW